MNLVPEFERWPIDRSPPRQEHAFPPEVTILRLPRAKGCDESDDFDLPSNDEAFQLIYDHYSSYLPNPEKYNNFCGDNIAVRRHEVLSCDPYFGGFVVSGNIAHLVVYDKRFKKAWCLECRDNFNHHG